MVEEQGLKSGHSTGWELGVEDGGKMNRKMLNKFELSETAQKARRGKLTELDIAFHAKENVV